MRAITPSTAGEYSGAFYTACPVAGNSHSILMETNVPEAETA